MICNENWHVYHSREKSIITPAYVPKVLIVPIPRDLQILVQNYQLQFPIFGERWKSQNKATHLLLHILTYLYHLSPSLKYLNNEVILIWVSFRWTVILDCNPHKSPLANFGPCWELWSSIYGKHCWKIWMGHSCRREVAGTLQFYCQT